MRYQTYHLSELKRKIVMYANEQEDEIGPCEVAAQFKVTHFFALKAIKELHRDGELVCADGCDKCEG